MDPKEKAKLLANYEVEWWNAHGRRNPVDAIDFMTEEYQLQFGLSYKTAFKAVTLRVKATQMHDLAEKYERKKDLVNAEKYWKTTEDLLRQHFELIV